MKWINFLHLYQPVNTDSFNIEEATKKSYERIFRVLEEHDNVKFTLNISGCLILRWEEMGRTDLIAWIKRLIIAGKLEIVGTAMYHPILPLIPREEVVRQIKENEQILKKHFGEDFKPRGFFLPEMAYSPQVAKVVKKQGYEWLILDEISFGGNLGEIDTSKIYKDKNSGLKIIFRNRKESNTYVPENLYKKLKKGNNAIFVTASDAELYGLRHEDPDAYLEKLVKETNIETILISEYIDSQKEILKSRLIKSNWNSSTEEIKNKDPYHVWFNKKNKIQMKMWKLSKLVYSTVYKNENDKNFEWARWHLVRGLISCNYWWASEKDFQLFSGTTWSPDEIERGLNDLTRAVRSLDNTETRDLKIKVEKISASIRLNTWKKHWLDHWKKYE